MRDYKSHKEGINSVPNCCSIPTHSTDFSLLCAPDDLHFGILYERYPYVTRVVAENFESPATANDDIYFEF